jgi:hypothetical protein
MTNNSKQSCDGSSKTVTIDEAVRLLKTVRWTLATNKQHPSTVSAIEEFLVRAVDAIPQTTVIRPVETDSPQRRLSEFLNIHEKVITVHQREALILFADWCSSPEEPTAESEIDIAAQLAKGEPLSKPTLQAAGATIRELRRQVAVATGLPAHVHSWDGDQCHYCHIPRSSEKAAVPRKTRYCDYDLCADTFDPAHSNNDH